jgi:antitoxin ParD1/3/4
VTTYDIPENALTTLNKISSLPKLTLENNVTKIYYLLVYTLIEVTAMSKNTSIALGEYFQNFVQEQIVQGRYGSVSEVIRAGLRLLEENETRLITLRKAIQEGIDSGTAEAFDIDEFISARDGGQPNA